MATLAQHTAARNDNDLLTRLIAAAEQASIPNAQQWAEQHRGALVSTQIGDTTIADVHAYAVATYEPTPPPRRKPGSGHRHADRAGCAGSRRGRVMSLPEPWLFRRGLPTVALIFATALLSIRHR